jgi:hypothetical protein
MRILYANVIEMHAGWGAEWFMNSAFQGLGHNTHCIDYRRNRYQLYRYFLEAPECDVFFLQRGDAFPIQIVKAVQIPRFFWTSELVSRCHDHDRLLKSRLFDHVFLRTPTCIDTVVSKKWLKREQCSVLLSAFDEKIHQLIPEMVKDIDVLFVGSITPRRKEFLNKLSKVCKLTIASVFGKEMVILMNRAKIVLNIHAENFLDTETRVFETLGCGAFLLTERLSCENPFSERDMVQFDSIDDMVSKIRYYLTHEQERETIAKQGYVSALNGHTYTHRAQEILDIMSVHLDEKSKNYCKPVRRDWRLHAYGTSEPFLRLGMSLSEVSCDSLSRVKQFVRNTTRDGANEGKVK